MRVLVACEFSGTVRDAFARRGHDAWSCDLLPTDRPGQHLQRNVLEVVGWEWDLLIAHPPCTYLASSGALYWHRRQVEQVDAINFVRALWVGGPARVCIENPIGKLSTAWHKPTQIVQPWQFGHGETKATCLWLRDLPPLKPTNIVEGRASRIANMPDSKGRQKARSVTYQGIAEAMAEQWGGPA